MHSSMMRATHSLPHRGLCLGVSVQGSLFRGSVTRGVSVQKDHGIRDRFPLKTTWDQAARQEVISYRDPIPREKNDARE